MDDWLDYIRFLLAIACFVLGCFLIYDLFANGFDWSVLVGSIMSFVAAHYLRPELSKDSKPDALDWIDAVDFVIDMPFRSFVYTIRAIGKVKNVDPFDA